MTATATNTLDLKRISESYFAAWAARDPDAVVAFHTADTQFWTHLGTAPVTGHVAMRTAVAELFDRFPEFAFEIYRVFYGPDHWVLDWALISGDIRFDSLDVVHLTPDGLIDRKDTFVDMVQLQTALERVNS